MQEDCYRVHEIDVAAFLTEPHHPTWEAFRRHYPSCASCTVEVYKWTQLEHALRTMGSNDTTSLHPSVETLTQFHTHPDRLSADTRQLIEQHLRTCVSCREEERLLGSFDFSLVEQWGTGSYEKNQSPLQQSLFSRVAAVLRALVLHPAFAYGLVFLLAVPLIRSYYSTPFDTTHSVPTALTRNTSDSKTEYVAKKDRQELSPTSLPAMTGRETEAQSYGEWRNASPPPTPLVQQSAPRQDFIAADETVATAAPESPPLQQREETRSVAREKMREEKVQDMGREQNLSEVTRPASSSSPVEKGSRVLLRAQAFVPVIAPLFEKYKAAYEARDLNRLGQVWQIDQAWRDSLRTLFVKSRRLALLIDPDETRIRRNSEEQQLFVPFVQIITVLAQDRQLATQGPFFCVARVAQRPPGQWIIHTLQEDPLHPGRCVPQ